MFVFTRLLQYPISISVIFIISLVSVYNVDPMKSKLDVNSTSSITSNPDFIYKWVSSKLGFIQIKNEQSFSVESLIYTKNIDLALSDSHKFVRPSNTTNHWWLAIKKNKKKTHPGIYCIVL